ncbi:hypothetical protein J8N05_35165 [Streptomyces sp. BH-SS-21]|uniref:Uncharacterized protein n=1 Tax=Streptomyces liliiviolaceus TaxID=2823109 RepID=A0A941BCR2_9ACTN|nr:hypothetical protein [Streptomyces liliiviolaceus]MBQ0853408.1 hypothetical protein [Streptomyces liliiviolaceus]
MSAQHAEPPHGSLPHLGTVADIRAELRDGRGLYAESFEADRARAMDTATTTDLHPFADVIKTDAGSIRAYSEPELTTRFRQGSTSSPKSRGVRGSRDFCRF